jgi:hypothetical protein
MKSFLHLGGHHSHRDLLPRREDHHDIHSRVSAISSPQGGGPRRPRGAGEYGCPEIPVHHLVSYRDLNTQFFHSPTHSFERGARISQNGGYS